jgi:hypothetical protein
MDDPGTRIDRLDAAGDTPGFRADAMLPAQFFSARRGAAAVEPVMRLMSAILIDAVRCFQHNFVAPDRHQRLEFREAQSWIFDDQGTGPFSFEAVCDTLGIGPHRLRDWIVRWEKDWNSGDKQRMIRRPPVNPAGRRRSRGRRVVPAAGSTKRVQGLSR